MKIPADWRAFIQSLNAHGVKYVIVGGYAVAFHGYPRFTADIDFFIEGSLENGQKLVAALQEFGFGSLELKPDDFAKADVVIQLGLPPNRIDLITTIDGISFIQAWETRVNALLDDMPAFFIGRNELIQNKRTAGRPKDAADIDNL